jgi:hypothetical protein
MKVRQITGEVLGGSKTGVWRSTTVPALWTIDVATFRPGSGKSLNFFLVNGKAVNVAVFAAQIEPDRKRAYILMVPASGKPSKLLIVITHGFAQNNRYYSDLGYSDPLSPPLIQDVLQRFVLERWGAQLMAASSDYALLLPVRARGGGHGELGWFISQPTMGAGIVEGIFLESGRAFGYDQVDLVTFSSGIYEADQFIAVGGKGLNFQRACNQDPAGGAAISRAVPIRKQYLSGQTTGGPRPGFEYLPLWRWEKEPNRKTLFPNDTFNYLHTWCIPMYTLYLAMAGP